MRPERPKHHPKHLARRRPQRRSRRGRAAAGLAASVLLAGTTLAGPGGPAHAAERDRYTASCRTSVEGSRVTAYCHNPYPRTDRVQLHVECDRWWDVDSDSAPVDVRPTAYAELTQRCWKEVRTAWVSHLPVSEPVTG
ncbi:hypothetical protein [Streptomyces sp. NPDC050856]|uniref:hypothetical protein n=1 Tax=Streptomyces sp. NPDC050856 TaxID=3154939 RepID=UPI0033E83E87